MTIGDNQQFICNSQPFCLCAGVVEFNKWDECCCTGGVVGCRTDICEACGAQLVLIDIDSGEEVKAA